MGASGHNGDVFAKVLFVEPDHAGGLPAAGGADESEGAAAVSGEIYATKFPDGDAIGSGVYLMYGIHCSLTNTVRFSLSLHRDG
jgi:hypothetical protein